MKTISTILFISILIGCSPKRKELLFNQGEWFSLTVEIFNPEKDTLLVVMGRPRGTIYYSYHVREYTDTTLVLKNTLNLKPSASLVSNEKDTLFKLTFIDSQNRIITRTNPYITINDSVKCMYNDYNSTFNFFDKVDSIYTLNLEFGEGFNFFIENLSCGKTVIRLQEYTESESRSDRTIMYHRDYYIKTNQKIDLADSSTLGRTLKLHSHDDYFNYRNTIDLNRKEFKRMFDWNNVPIK
jgi:hypothetical protein